MRNMRKVRILGFLTFLNTNFNMPTSDVGEMKKKRERKRGTKVPRTGRRKKSERIPGARNEIYTSQIESVKFIQATTTIGLYKNGIGWMTCIKLTAYHAGQWTKEENAASKTIRQRIGRRIMRKKIVIEVFFIGL
jgi:hypothetical protein